MMHTSSAQTDRAELPTIALRLFRAPDHGKVVARALSEAYGGLMTHWRKDRSEYCPVRPCKACKGGIEQKWKGYFAAEVWEESRRWWMPKVFEITEIAELDMRHLFRRGTVWEFEKVRREPKKPLSLQATLLDQLEPGELPSAFDLESVLFSIYRVRGIPLDVPCPLPDRVRIEPTAGAPPKRSPRSSVTNAAPPSEQAAFFRAEAEKGRKGQAAQAARS